MKKTFTKVFIFLILLVSICCIYQLLSSQDKKESKIKLIKQSNDGEMLSNEEISIRNFYSFLAKNEKKVYSQNKEDGVIEAIFESLNIPDLSKYFVEFSPADGTECNTRYLRTIKKWKGIMFDGKFAEKSINLYAETIHVNTILNLFEKYNISTEIDLMSEDTDYADYWIIQIVLKYYRPKVLVHEVNQQEKCVTVKKSDELIIWDGSDYHGGSVCAFYCLAKENDYSMVYCESAGVNCFWIRNDIIKKYLRLNIKILQKTLNPQFLLKKPEFVYPSTLNKWHEVKC